MGNTYLILSGKGGVGKTTIATSLALTLGKRGLSVALVDADVGLRCADLLLGMQNDVVYDAGDVLEKRCTLQKALIRHPGVLSLKLLSAPQLASPSDIERKEMTKLISKLNDQFDFVLIDCPAGVGRGLKNVWESAQDAILVATPDDACIRDAERVSALLHEKTGVSPWLLLNRVSRYLIWEGEEQHPGQIAQGLDLPILAVIPDSGDVYRALLSHKTAVECDSRAVRKAISLAADKMMGMTVKQPKYWSKT